MYKPTLYVFPYPPISSVKIPGSDYWHGFLCLFSIVQDSSFPKAVSPHCPHSSKSSCCKSLPEVAPGPVLPRVPHSATSDCALLISRLRSFLFGILSCGSVHRHVLNSAHAPGAEIGLSAALTKRGKHLPSWSCPSRRILGSAHWPSSPSSPAEVNLWRALRASDSVSSLHPSQRDSLT